MVKKSISVTSQQDDWIKTQIKSGQYGNESEVVRDLIRERLARETELDAIRTALVAGERSGTSTRSVEDIWQEARHRHLSQRG
ncbi:MAG: type II toxin-antitoxin system ParD family antitoxin [Alphaproteobacteria bacterium]